MQREPASDIFKLYENKCRRSPASHPRERKNGRNLTAAAAVLTAALLAAAPAVGEEPAKLSVLMLGDDGHHRPADLAKLITPILAKDGIDVRYTEDVDGADAGKPGQVRRPV